MASPDRRRASAAQEIDPKGLEGTSLGDRDPVNGEFNRTAANDNERQPEQPSEQVGKSGASPRMKPPHDLDRAGSRTSHRDGMAKDDLASKLSPRQLAVYEAVMQRMAQERGVPSPSQDLGR